jgi:3D (Asp-Asp-Asp) domain-containing protein
MTLLMAALLGALSLLGPTGAPADGACEPYTITSYAAEDYPGPTADGSTTTWGALDRGEQIVAASTNLPYGTWVEVEGLGGGRVADRGRLGARHIDWLVPTHAEAVEIGRSVRMVCASTPDELG